MPKLRLGAALDAKLCLAGQALTPRRYLQAAATSKGRGCAALARANAESQSPRGEAELRSECVPNLEVGNEGASLARHCGGHSPPFGAELLRSISEPMPLPANAGGPEETP